MLEEARVMIIALGYLGTYTRSPMQLLPDVPRISSLSGKKHPKHVVTRNLHRKKHDGSYCHTMDTNNFDFI